MRHRLRPLLPWIALWLLVSVAGSAWIARSALDRLRDAFETDARIVHRLLSQRVGQHDAIMATLALLSGPDDAAQPEQRLASVYPQILGVQRRDGEQAWPEEQLRAADVLSRARGRPVLSEVDFSRGRYQIVQGVGLTSHALRIDIRAMVPWSEWPMAPDRSPVRVILEHEGQRFVLQAGAPDGGTGWRFDFRKHLAADSQPFDVVAVRQVRWSELPWGWMAAWTAALGAVLAALLALQRQRAERRRGEELLRLGQVARLNTLGELAAGMAHELNQPLTAVLANTQAAGRLLREDPPDLDTARSAMTQAAEQARRASQVVGRLRRAVERPDLAAQTCAVPLADAVRAALYLLEPEFTRRQVSVQFNATDPSPVVMADPVALEQITHNLLRNALQALEQVAPEQRRLELRLGIEEGLGVLRVSDSGPGIPPDVLPRIFEPFFTTRQGGLGLGLSLCETLATSMGGSLSAAAHAPQGATLRLSLPLATSA
ncbi:MAG: ATP-binding protein [Burkholderiaceae bacterium]|nr:ATP-binding protein [Burkholderiaceae bacterium]